MEEFIQAFGPSQTPSELRKLRVDSSTEPTSNGGGIGDHWGQGVSASGTLSPRPKHSSK